MKKTHRRGFALGIALAVLLLPAAGGFAQGVNGEEEFRYHWQLRNLVGWVAGLFFPRQGIGELSFRPQKNGHLKSELVITSPESNQGEYWKYGSEIDLRTLQPLRAWSSYFWRGRSKTKEKEIEQAGVMDVSSAIYSIRHERPRNRQRLEIWSDGDIFPVDVIPLGLERRQIRGRAVDAYHYAIRGTDLPDRLHWKGKVDLWLANDATATPVEIDISRSLADLRLELEAGGSSGAS